ncbi:hypothetical protein SAMN05421835_11588 [Amycolatopsis sacchari]|uniref:Uncharacterized protein n=1 Tax=Amycolatopsis sacchari TaxID=115433 RepID=A0A1I3XGN5_9PSEU|nr:hypothetical protein SAMN05421835_11588 [Amycolatopsis sacchari]
MGGAGVVGRVSAPVGRCRGWRVARAGPPGAAARGWPGAPGAGWEPVGRPTESRYATPVGREPSLRPTETTASASREPPLRPTEPHRAIPASRESPVRPTETTASASRSPRPASGNLTRTSQKPQPQPAGALHPVQRGVSPAPGGSSPVSYPGAAQPAGALHPAQRGASPAPGGSPPVSHPEALPAWPEAPLQPPPRHSSHLTRRARTPQPSQPSSHRVCTGPPASSGSSRAWSDAVVGTPSTRSSASACRARLSASPRVAPQQISFAIIES